MTRSLLSLAAFVLAAPLAAQDVPQGAEPPALTLQQQTNLRCGVAFGLVAGYQDRKDERGDAYPAMEPRGKEFFVRTTARIMEDERFTRDVVTALIGSELAYFDNGSEEGYRSIESIMPACLALLDASGI